ARHAATRDLRGARGHPPLLRLRLEVGGGARPLGEGSPRRVAARGTHHLTRSLHGDAGRLPLAVRGPLDGIPGPLAMQPIFTAAETRALDARAIETLGIPGPRLMENAGRGAAAVIAREWAPLRGKRVLALCGRGNNGGDGFVVARHLPARGARVRVLLAGRPGAAQALGRWGGKVEEIGDESGLGLLARAFAEADLVVDGLLGTGSTGAARGVTAQIIEQLNRAAGRDGLPVIALDLPSGLGSDD